MSNRERGLIEFDGDSFEGNIDRATINFTHRRTQSAEQAALLRQYFQRKASKAEGRIIPIDEISIYPDAGEEYDAETTFSVAPGRELYPGLQVIHQESPFVLLQLIEDLHQFAADNELGEKELELVRYAITELISLITPPTQE